MLKRILAGLIAAAVLPAASYYTLRLEDSKAVYLTPGDAAADASDTIQQAIDKVQANGGEGIVFVPEGRYRLTKTVYIPAAVRLIGYGAARPVFFLGANTPGYQDPANEKYMIFFSGRGRGDAGAGTFYSGMSNIDLEILEGNAGAVGVRGRYAQHCILAHMDFRTGSGLAGVHETGNVMEDVSFHGGQYGIWTGTPSPAGNSPWWTHPLKGSAKPPSAKRPPASRWCARNSATCPLRSRSTPARTTNSG